MNATENRTQFLQACEDEDSQAFIDLVDLHCQVLIDGLCHSIGFAYFQLFLGCIC